MQGFINLIDIYGERFLVAGVSLLSLTFVTLMFLWGYNRRRFMAYKHYIPARVMQGYLDSIIQNSSALKSSLLRGGGANSAEVAAPSVYSLEQMQQHASSGALVRGSSSLADAADENNQDDDMQLGGDTYAPRSAELNALKMQISEKDTMITDLEEKMTEILAKFREAEDRAEKLQEAVSLSHGQVGKSAAPASSDLGMNVQIDEVVKERDLLKEKLREYEFIENDLAEIPRLQRTVETLKRTLQGMGVDPDQVGKTAEAPPATATSAATTAAIKPTTLDASPGNIDAAMKEVESAESVKTAAPVAGTAAPAAPGDKKDDNDLLQQFEKMLG